MSQDIDVFAAEVGAEMLRRKYSIKRDGPKLIVGLGEYFMIEVVVEEEDPGIGVADFSDLLETAFKTHLDKLHEEDIERIAQMAEATPNPSAPLGATIVEDIEVKPKTIRDHVRREFIRVRSERLKRASK